MAAVKELRTRISRFQGGLRLLHYEEIRVEVLPCRVQDIVQFVLLEFNISAW